MSAPAAPRRVPGWLIAAAVAPTLMAGLLEAARELGYPAPGVEAGTLVLVWAFTTVPLVILLLGMRRGGFGGPDPGHEADIKAALEAVGRAERVASSGAAILQRVDATLAARGPDAAAAPAAPRRTVPWLTVVVVGLLLVAGGGLAFAFTQAAHKPEQVHIHASFAVYADGEKLDFSSVRFDLTERRELGAHLHAPDGSLMHIEGPAGLTLGEFFTLALEVNLTRATLQLDDLVHGGAAYAAGGGKTLRLFVDHAGHGDLWELVEDPPAYVMRDGDRLLLTFGDAQGDVLAAQQASVPAPAGAPAAM